MKKCMALCLLSISIFSVFETMPYEKHDDQRYIKTYNAEGKDKRLEKLAKQEEHSILKAVAVRVAFSALVATIACIIAVAANANK